MIHKNIYNTLREVKIRYIFLVLLSIIFSSVFSQTDIIFVTANAKTADVIVDQGSTKNALICKTSRNGIEREYYPSDIYGYMFQNGTKYYSKRISIDDSVHQVFLEVLSEGTISLLYFNDNNSQRFFIQSKDGDLHEIYSKEESRKLDFNKALKDLFTECDQVTDQKDLVRFTRRGLKTFINHYNSCSLESISLLRYGATLGYGMFTQTPKTLNTEMNLLNFGYFGAANFGFFLEYPLNISHLSLHLDMLFLKQSYWENYKSSVKEIDFVANVYSIHAPILIRYTVPKSKFRPFYNLGLSLVYNFKKEETFSWARYSNDNSIYLKYPDNQFVSDFQIGFTLGAGLEYAIKSSYSIFGEFRYNILYGNPTESFTTKYTHLNVGVKF